MKTLTEERLAVLLKDKAVEIFVSEPFGFEYPRGGTGMRARVSEVRLGERGDASAQALRLELETPFVSEEGPLITRLTAGRRHKLREGIVEMLAGGERVPANLSYLDQVPEERRLPGTTPKLIGSVRLAD